MKWLPNCLIGNVVFIVKNLTNLAVLAVLGRQGMAYHIARKFGGELNLAVWRSELKLPN